VRFVILELVTRRYWTLLLILASLWGASYLFIELGLEDLSPAMVVFGRTLLAGVVLLPLALRRGALTALRGRAGAVAGLAALQVAGPFLLISFGQEEITSSLAGILVATAPIFTALLAIFIDHEERSSGWRLVGVFVGIAGVALLLGVDVGGDGAALVGALMVVLASLGYALGSFVLKRRLSGGDPVGAVTATMLASAALTAPFALATAPSDAPGLGALAAVTTLGVLGTGIAFVIFYSLIAEFGPARASVVAYIAPGFAVVYGVTLLGEPFTAGTAAGLLLILAGSWMAAEGRRLPWQTPALAPAPAPGQTY
jgi:drug/metabolite transporter (DMT)-like permease